MYMTEKVKSTISVFIICLISVVLLTGCEDSTKKKAIQENIQLKTELEKLKRDFAQIEGEKKALKENLDKVTQSLDKAKADLVAAVQVRDKLQESTFEQSKKANSAQDTISFLTEKLQEQTKEITTLKDTISKLQTQLLQIQKPPVEVNMPATVVPVEPNLVAPAAAPPVNQ